MMGSFLLLWVVLFWGALSVLIYIYVGYPLLIGLLARFFPKPHQQGPSEVLPGVSIVVAAYQEAAVIYEKLDNFLELDYPAELLEMIVVSDGSTDGTDALVSAFPCRRVRLIRQEPRQGKATALGIGFREAKFEMLVLTDANVVFEPDAIRQLMRHFADPQVGVVTGRVHLLDEKEGYAQAESAYYRYERFLQTSEAAFHSVVGVDGALYALRSELAIPPPPTALLDDLVHSMSIAKRGTRIIYEPQAQAYERAAPSMFDEFRRKKRLALGGFQMLLKRWALPTWHTPRLLFCFISHKLLRWLGPWFLLVMWLANALLVGHHWFYSMFFAGQMLFYALAFIGLLVPTSRSWSCCSIPMYFVQMNAAFLFGGLQAFFAPSSRGLWRPNARVKS